jgi:hypothetical protein
MGNFGNSLSKELGKNTGRVISNVVFGDKWSTPKRVSATVTVAKLRAEEASLKAQALKEKAEIEYDLEIEKIKLEQSFLLQKEEDAILQHITKIQFQSDENQIFNDINELFAIYEGNNSEKIKKVSIEKIKVGLFKLSKLNAEEEFIFFSSKLKEKEDEILNNKKNEDKLRNQKKIILICGIVLILVSIFMFFATKEEEYINWEGKKEVYEKSRFHPLLSIIVGIIGSWVLVVGFRKEIEKYSEN